jgi:hypothetical protein
MQSFNPPRPCRVIKAYQSTKAEPISFEAGENVYISEKVDRWNNNPEWIWVWCTNQREKSDWVPQNFLHKYIDTSMGVALERYIAVELTANEGEELLAKQELNGWLWCIKRLDEAGWIPLENIAWL